MTVELKPGDRVRITLEGTVKYLSDRHIVLMFKGTEAYSTFFKEELDAGKIEMLRQNPKVGDRVKTSAGYDGVILAFKRTGEAAVELDDGAGYFYMPEDLEVIS